MVERTAQLGCRGDAQCTAPCALLPSRRPGAVWAAYRGAMHRRSAADARELRRLLHHEARVHAATHRTIRDLGDGVLLTDPVDRDPSINRLVGPSWPQAGEAFDRRLDEVVTLFATVDRRPHIWAATGRLSGDPTVNRLLEGGFRLLGSADYLVLEEWDAVRALSARALPAGVEISPVGPSPADGAPAAAREIAWVVGDAFDLDPVFRVVIESDAVRSIGRAGTEFALLRLDGEPAAVAKRVTLDGVALLSSIGTRRVHRGRGFGRLVTAVAAVRALNAGARFVYLAVEEGNDGARRMYEDLGFMALRESAAHLIVEG
jgi:ribosomal protein S18 acetylase RimI-like enzyme